MLKSLFATCLTALSVNTQPLAPSRSIEPSRAITSDTTFNVGDNVILDVTPTVNSNFSYIQLFDDGSYNQLKIIDFNIFNTSTLVDVLIITETYLVGYSNFTPNLEYGSTDVDVFYSEDIDTGLMFSINLRSQSINNPLRYTVTFEILEGFEGFTYEALPYLTKVENPYTPPSKSNLYRLLYDFYYSIFNDDDLASISTGYNMPFDNWLAHTCTIATLITLIVVAFFFLRWLFKVISGLILLKR